MILRRTSQDFRKFFLLQFTQELIKNSIPKDYLLEKSLKEPEEQINIKPVHTINENVIQRVFNESKKKYANEFTPEPKQEQRPFFKPLPQSPRPKIFSGSVKIPQTPLPPHLRNLQPIPGSNVLDLEKLNPPIKDPLVSVIECNGAEEPIIVRGRIGTKTTKIILSEEEIDKVIQKFARASKIPVSEGIYKVAVGKLIFSAIISEVTGTKFIITKMGVAHK